jgi:hypothetical protein
VIYDHDSSARDLWQSYQQSNLVAKQVGLAKEINLALRCIFVLQARIEPRNLAIGEYDFEGVREFSYLGTNINSEDKVNADIQKGIMAGNRA